MHTNINSRPNFVPVPNRVRPQAGAEVAGRVDGVPAVEAESQPDAQDDEADEVRGEPVGHLVVVHYGQDAAAEQGSGQHLVFEIKKNSCFFEIF